MTLDQYRPLATRLLSPWVALVKRLGLTPDAVSVVAFAFSVAAAGAFYLAGRGQAWWYGVGALLVVANGWLDVLDGQLARDLGTDSPAGDLLDHVLDRYADVIVIAGLAAGIERYALGFAAVTGVLLTSYLGTQAEAVGLDRVYGGVLGRADRLVLVGLVTAVSVVVTAVGGYTLVAWLLGLFAVVGHVTALQRFWSAWRQLE